MPAVFGVTREPLVVYTSNVFAILGLRAMFFLLSGALDRFHALKHGLAAVLVFVGLKMVWLDHLFGGRFPIGASLIVISSVIALSIVLSLVFPKTAGQPAKRKRADPATTVRWILAGTFLAMAAVSVLYAIGLGHDLYPLPALVTLGALPLYLSAACYVFCAVILARGAKSAAG